RPAPREFGDVAAALGTVPALDAGPVLRAARAEWWESWWQDLRFAARALRRRPAFTAAVLLTLGLGLGVTGAVFAVADAALLRPLPYAAPDRLVAVWRHETGDPTQRGDLSYPELLDLRTRVPSLASVAGYHSNRMVLGADQPRVLWAGKTSANFFATLGVRPAAGRFFVEGEDEAGNGRVVVLSHGLWRRQFGGDPSVVGRTLPLDGASYTVVGVLPADFQFAPVGEADVWVPFDRPADWRPRRTMSWFRGIARLRGAATETSAARELDALAAALAVEHPRNGVGLGLRAEPLRDAVTGPVRPVLVTVLGAAALVLVVALANVANLLLVLGAARGRELTVRAALGAGGGRLARQLVTEGVLLSALGGALGLALATVGVRALVAAIPPERLRGMPYLADVGGPRLALALLASVMLAGAAFELVSAWRLVRPRRAEALHGGRGLSDGAAGGRLRDGLVAAELGLTVVLLTGAALFGRSLSELFAVDPGFRAERVATAFIPLPRVAYASRPARVAFFERLEERLRALPDVESVGMTTKLPLDPGNSGSYRVVGAPEPPPGREPSASFRSVTRDYFRTMGIPLLRGATFPERVDSSASPLVVVSASLAREAWGTEDPIGRRLDLMGREPATVVGVVGDVSIGRLEDAAATPTYYVPFAQAPDISMRVVVRTRAEPAAVEAAIRAAVREIDPEVALYQVYPMESLVRQSESVFLRRFPLLLVGAFAAAALALAVVGTHGVVAYAVAQRVRELGIRVALGAASRDVVALVVGHVARVAALGIGAGLVLALLLARAASGLLYGVRPTDPATYAAVAVTLAAVAAGAAFVPARRATRVDPSIALRAE
ncbi:ADOP family duplicated permease, partial [Roseisolibacter sp. H3M3-2]|uniref:ADOP family duplicated permease n=1 Tax=Roseisolibacter sp. H3M3-2 TaxID=3031323 RepID=UPI0023DA7A35